MVQRIWPDLDFVKGDTGFWEWLRDMAGDVVAQGAGGSIVATLDDLTDVDTGTIPAGLQVVLAYDPVSNEWKATANVVTDDVLARLDNALTDPSEFVAAGGGSVLNGSLEIGPNGGLIFTDANGGQWVSPKPMVNTSGQLVTQMLSASGGGGGGQPAVVGYVGGTEAHASAAAGSVALPPNVQAGQLMLLFISAVNAGTALTMSAAPSGWALQAAWNDTSGTSGINGWIYSKTAGSGGTAMDWGISNNSLATIESALGHPADIVRDYAWIDHWVSSWATLAVARKMFLSWKFRTDAGSVSATSIWNGTTGAHDTSLQTFCTNFVNMPAPPSGAHHATFQHELNAAAAQATGSNAQLIAAFQHCCNVLRATPGFNPSIHKIGACLTGASGAGGGSTNHTAQEWLSFFTAIYVPGTYADEFWLDQPYWNSVPNPLSTVDSVIGAAVDWCTTNYPAMPIYIGEWGAINTMTAAQFKSVVEAFAAKLKTSRYAGVKGLMYWNGAQYTLSAANIAEWASLEPGGASDAGNTVSWTLSASAKQNAIAAAYKDVNSVSTPVTSGSDDVATNQIAAPGVNPGHEILEFYASLNQGGNVYTDPGNVSRRVFSPGNGANSPDGLLVDSNGVLSSGGDTATSSQQVSRSIAATVALHASSIQFVSAATNPTPTNSTTVSATVPSNVLAGDKIIVMFSLAFGGTDVALSTPPSGYSAVGSRFSQATGSASVDAWVYQKTATGGDAGATVTAVFASSVKCQMTILVYRGVTSLALATGGDAAQTSHTLPTVTAANWVVVGVSSRSSTVNTYTGPSGYTPRALQQGSGGGNVDSYVADSGGQSSTGGGTVVSSASSSVAVMWALTLT
jgi:hypothetical protein